MSYDKRNDKRRKKRERKKKFRLVFIFLILVYLMFRSLPSLVASNSKTVLPERDILIDEVLTQGFIMKNESVTKSATEGELELFANEGIRVSAGTKVATTSSLDGGAFLKQELEQIENSINALKNSEENTEVNINDNEQVENIQQDLAMELQDLINEGEYKEIYLLKEKLALYNSKAKEVISEDELLGQSLEKLKERRKKISTQIEENHIDYYTDTGGIISYKIDGYEGIFTPKDFENYSYEKIDIDSIKIKGGKDKAKTVVNEPIYKLIDNFQWYVGIIIEDINNIKEYEDGDKIIIRMKDDEEEIQGRVIAINNSKNKSILILELNTKCHEYYDKRFPELYLIKNKAEGYKIPAKAVVDKDSTKGLYIKDSSGIVKFRPINIIGEDEENVYVEIGDNSSQINIKGMEEPVRTISVYDEIFINTFNIKEGQILN